METINGFQCKNCTDVDYAKKHIDPAHPKDGPYGINAQDAPGKPKADPAVVFSGALTALARSDGPGAADVRSPSVQQTGSVLNLTA